MNLRARFVRSPRVLSSSQRVCIYIYTLGAMFLTTIRPILLWIANSHASNPEFWSFRPHFVTSIERNHIKVGRIGQTWTTNVTLDAKCHNYVPISLKEATKLKLEAQNSKTGYGQVAGTLLQIFLCHLGSVIRDWNIIESCHHRAPCKQNNYDVQELWAQH